MSNRQEKRIAEDSLARSREIAKKYVEGVIVKLRELAAELERRRRTLRK